MLSVGLWALVPKCPMCLAAYMALWTGIGLSFTQASYIRWGLMLTSGGLLCILVLNRLRRWRLAR